jgi:AcrR family transcriptional regulator
VTDESKRIRARTATRATDKPGGRARQDAEQVREQIIDAFSAKAKRVGLRGIMMVELASELRMSASTLYKHFPSKESLTLTCVERWVDELAAADAARYDRNDSRDGFERFTAWLDAWATAVAAVSPAFVQDLQSDYPAAWKRFRKISADRSARGAALLKSLLKPELDERVALSILDLIVTTVQRPEFAERLGVTRREAIRSAVSIWASGAINRRGKVKRMRASSAKD